MAPNATRRFAIMGRMGRMIIRPYVARRRGMFPALAIGYPLAKISLAMSIAPRAKGMPEYSVMWPNTSMI